MNLHIEEKLLQIKEIVLKSHYLEDIEMLIIKKLYYEIFEMIINEYSTEEIITDDGILTTVYTLRAFKRHIRHYRLPP